MTSSAEIEPADLDAADWSVYLHVPFCDVRCPYCHFACFVNQVEDFELRWARALRREFERWAPALGPNSIVSLYIGGGTPTALPAAARAELCAFVGQELGPRMTADAEFTLEANPESLRAAELQQWLDVGLNRLSIGVQSMNAEVLAFLGRSNTPASNLRALELACARVENVSADLIVASPRDDAAAVAASIEAITSFPVSHLSAYLLEIHAETRFGRDVARGLWQPTPAKAQSELYLRMVEDLGRRGYEAYELSNFAQPGRQSRHNQRYWTRDAYLGLGPSAHSFAADRRWWNVRDARPWCEAIEAEAQAVAEVENLDRRTILRERLLLGLRRREGVPQEWLADHGELVAEFRRAGWLEFEAERVRATVEGWLLLDELVLRLWDT